MKLSNLGARVATTVVAAPFLVAAVEWRRPEGLWAIVLLGTVLGLHEYFRITHNDPVERGFGVGLGTAIALAVYWLPVGVVLAPLAAVVAPALFYLFRFRSLESVWPRLGTTTFGVLYVGMLFTFLAVAKNADPGHGADWIWLCLAIAWLGDTAAYFAGRFLGRRKLYPAISPGKTWVGAAGGLAGSLLGAILANLWFFPELGWGHGAILTVVGGTLGQCGDLVESMLKRAYGVKDSGHLLPGHGGILDRVDALLFIAPWVVTYRALFWP